jgi:NAD(P)-dependent dehydrogenase (short-subunit alcohol dehydrogenase family)
VANEGSSVRLQGRVAIITGGGAGIGRAICIRLAAEGARVAVLDIDGETAAAVAAEIVASGGGGLAITADIAEPDEVARAIARVEGEFGRIDILVNNAGVRHVASIADETPQSWRRTLDVDLTGAFFCLQAVLPAMRRQGGGKIVNIGSISGMRGFVNRAAYCAAKAGMHGLTRQAAAELAPLNIQVNAIAPGYIDTALATYPDEMVSAMLATSPTPRRGQAAEVAGLAAFLASGDSDLVTGTVIPLDGGVTSSVLIDAPPWRADFGAL